MIHLGASIHFAFSPLFSLCLFCSCCLTVLLSTRMLIYLHTPVRLMQIMVCLMTVQSLTLNRLLLKTPFLGHSIYKARSAPRSFSPSKIPAKMRCGCWGAGCRKVQWPGVLPAAVPLLPSQSSRAPAAGLTPIFARIGAGAPPKRPWQSSLPGEQRLRRKQALVT